MSTMSNHSKFLTAIGLAERWHTTLDVIYHLRYQGDAPPAIKLGRQLRFSIEDVERWEQGHRDDGGPSRADGGREMS